MNGADDPASLLVAKPNEEFLVWILICITYMTFQRHAALTEVNAVYCKAERVPATCRNNDLRMQLSVI